jgi:hypothetical protein
MQRHAMRARASRSPLNTGLAWLVWLALLLPLAQSVASWHGYTHAGTGTTSARDEPQSPHGLHCDLCLAASAIGSGAPAAMLPALPLALARHALPPAAAGSVWQALLALGFSSRAPPVSPR